MFYLLSDVGGLLPNPVQATESVFCFVEPLRQDPNSRQTCATWGTRILQTGSSDPSFDEVFLLAKHNVGLQTCTHWSCPICPLGHTHTHSRAIESCVWFGVICRYNQVVGWKHLHPKDKVNKLKVCLSSSLESALQVCLKVCLQVCLSTSLKLQVCLSSSLESARSNQRVLTLAKRVKFFQIYWNKRSYVTCLPAPLSPLHKSACTPNPSY